MAWKMTHVWPPARLHREVACTVNVSKLVMDGTANPSASYCQYELQNTILRWELSMNGVEADIEHIFACDFVIVQRSFSSWLLVSLATLWSLTHPNKEQFENYIKRLELWMTVNKVETPAKSNVLLCIDRTTLI